MTAIVGILNSRGLAFAADSAATLEISSTHKITNHANKIFELSKYVPVGVALYGNLDFMQLPWEQIVKMYRKHLSDTEFDTVSDFADDFFIYVRNLLSPFQDSNYIKRRIQHFVNSFYDEIANTASDLLKQKNQKLSNENMISFMRETMCNLGEDYKKYKVCRDFEGISLEDFTSMFGVYIDEKLQECLSVINCANDFKQIFTETLYFILRSDRHVYSSFTGLVFFGYGTQDLQPSYFAYEISELYDSKIKIIFRDKYRVRIDGGACIAPFAQTDVANTVVRGIDNDLRQLFYRQNQTALSQLVETIIAKLEEANAPQQLLDVLSGIDINSLSNIFQKSMDEIIWEKYVSKLMDIVKFLSKEDLADMAESLVKMTGLKRRVTTDEESVGGPVDVAVVTKGDGFVWIKRKHYFESELNPNYFQRLKRD